jgi:hypothetical protein
VRAKVPQSATGEHQIYQEVKEQIEMEYRRKGGGKRSNSSQEGVAVAAAGKVTARDHMRQFNHVLAGAITSYRTIPPKAPSGE